MSPLHPHWQATDDAPVPVRVAASKQAPVTVSIGTTTVSRRPAAIVGILMAFSIGAVAYGTLDDGTAPLSGELMDGENPMSYFDVLSEQMVSDSIQENFEVMPEDVEMAEPVENSIVYREELEPSIPVNPSTYDMAPAVPQAALPMNQNTIGTTVTESFHSGAPRPIAQPQTGAGMLWMTILGALAGVAWKSREILRA